MFKPPFYVLCSHSTVSSPSQGPLSSNLGHPAIQYHYADDSPLALSAQHPDEHVLVLDYDPTSTHVLQVQSTSGSIGIASLKVEDAPGAAATDDSDPKNDKMYIIETVANDSMPNPSQAVEQQSSSATLALFKRRNAAIRRILSYPDTHPSDDADAMRLPDIR